MRRRVVFHMCRWVPFSGVVLGFVLGAGVFLTIPAPGTSDGAASDSFTMLLLPWWLLGILLMLLGGWMQHISAVPAPLTIQPLLALDTIDDLTIPLVPRMRTVERVTTPVDDLTIPMTSTQFRAQRWWQRGY